jgi:periplasmic protein TonB
MSPLRQTSSQLHQMPFGRATAWSVVAHTLGPVLGGLGLLLLAWLLSVLLHLNLWDWLFPHPKKATELTFVLLPATDSPKPPDSHLLGNENQQASGSPAKRPSAEPLTQVAPAQPVVPKTAPAPMPTLAPPVPVPLSPALMPPPKPEATPSPTVPTKPLSLPSPSQPPPMQAKPTASQPDTPALLATTVPALDKPADSHQSATASPDAPTPDGPSKAAVAQSDQARLWTPFMDELKKRLTRNWQPPRGEQNRKVVVRLEVAKDGQLVSVAIDKTSGQPDIDQAALTAVEQSAPFTALPETFTQASVPILFTFDYTIVGIR